MNLKTYKNLCNTNNQKATETQSKQNLLNKNLHLRCIKHQTIVNVPLIHSNHTNISAQRHLVFHSIVIREKLYGQVCSIGINVFWYRPLNELTCC